MINIKNVSILFVLLSSFQVFAQAKIMNSGEAFGQYIVLSVEDVVNESDKYKSLNPLSIPVFAELPLDLTVTAGAITLKQQNLLSHVQLKSRARGTPNLDISNLELGIKNPLLNRFNDGDWIHMKLNALDGSIFIEASNQEAAQRFYDNKTTEEVTLVADICEANTSQTECDLKKKIYTTAELGYKDFIRVGSKAANYAELAKALNTSERTVVRPGFAVPMAFYQEFLLSNPQIVTLIEDVTSDPIMNDLMDTQYRAQRLEELRTAMMGKDLKVSSNLINNLLDLYDQQFDNKGKLLKMKMRSSTNSEDLPNFNGAGLYTSVSYKPYIKKVEKTRQEKEETLREVLQEVWSSVWTLRAFDERNFFRIPHMQVMMAMQVNPSFSDEEADGVVLTKNVSGDARFPGSGVYIETQRGDVHGVANPVPGAKPQKILVLFDNNAPLNTSAYNVVVLQNSNIADDDNTILPNDNPKPVMKNKEAIDLALQTLKAREHFRPLIGNNDPNFELDLEFKIDSADTDKRQVYLKQARPLIQ